jgi:hypothetical protein
MLSKLPIVPMGDNGPLGVNQPYLLVCDPILRKKLYLFLKAKLNKLSIFTSKHNKYNLLRLLPKVDYSQNMWFLWFIVKHGTLIQECSPSFKDSIIP